MRYRLRTLFLIQALVLIVPILLSALGIVGFHYPRAIDNDPLVSPVGVRVVDAKRLVLDDGREFQFVDGLDESIFGDDSFGNRADLELQPDGLYVVYVERRGWICGTPWARMFNFDLIPDDVPINHRVPAGVARLVATDSTKVAAATSND
jgi:hypothetical protein